MSGSLFFFDPNLIYNQFDFPSHPPLSILPRPSCYSSSIVQTDYIIRIFLLIHKLILSNFTTVPYKNV